jgi:hypothetical protein
LFSPTTVKYFSNKRKPGKTKAFFICLLIAAFLWLAHTLNTVYTYTIKLPVTFRNMPLNKKPLMQLPDQIYADVKASGLKLSLILLSRPFQPLEIDINKLKTSNRNQNYILSTSQIDFKKVLNFETQIKHVSPDTLYFSEKTGFQKIVPVKIPLFIKCREGYGFRKPVINPNFITIWGDTTVLATIDTIYTQPLTLNNLSQNVNSDIAFIRPDHDVYTSVNSAHVYIEVARLIEHTLMLPVSDVSGADRQQVNIYPSQVQVRFTSLQSAFHESDTSMFRARIDSRKLNRRTKKCPVYLSVVPTHVTIMDIEPPEVEILILKK